jgi:hypothetical protein
MNTQHTYRLSHISLSCFGLLGSHDDLAVYFKGKHILGKIFSNFIAFEKKCDGDIKGLIYVTGVYFKSRRVESSFNILPINPLMHFYEFNKYLWN